MMRNRILCYGDSNTYGYDSCPVLPGFLPYIWLLIHIGLLSGLRRPAIPCNQRSCAAEI